MEGAAEGERGGAEAADLDAGLELQAAGGLEVNGGDRLEGVDHPADALDAAEDEVVEGAAAGTLAGDPSQEEDGFDHREDGLEELERRAEGEADAGGEAALAELVGGFVEEGCGLGGEEDEVYAGVGEVRDEAQGVLGGEVDLEGERGERSERRDGAGGEALVGDGVPVEDVEVEEVDAGGFEGGELFTEAGVVGVEEGAAEADGGRRRRHRRHGRAVYPARAARAVCAARSRKGSG